MAELGYHRSAKKCKEKFENVYKYHKRTKDGRVGKADGKTYRFFDQLQALEQHHVPSSTLPPSFPVTPGGQSQAPIQEAVPVTMVIPAGTIPAGMTVSSSPHPVTIVHTNSITATPPQPQQIHVTPIHHPSTMAAIPTHSSIQMETPSSPSATQSWSSSTSSDEGLLGRKKRKRKWKDFFEKLMKEVIDKQEKLQKSLLDVVEKREHDQVAREEAWKMQEMARLNQEHERLVRERSMAAAKDAAIMAFLQKLAEKHQIPLPLPEQVQVQNQDPTTQPAARTIHRITQQQPQPQQQGMQPQPPPQSQVNVLENQLPTATQTQLHPQAQPVPPLPQQAPPPSHQAIVVANTNNHGDNVNFQKSNNGDNVLQASSSRWPKAEVQALINLRTNLDQKYQENGPKGPLWEEISASMIKLGYNRNAKRCKEKWENINKYFKKVKESNKKRPEDSKTCPYFHQLDALYRGKTKLEITYPSSSTPTMKPEGTLSATGTHVMVEPEQKWPTLHTHSDQDETEDEEEDEEEEQESGGYEIVANNRNANAGSMTTTTASTRIATAKSSE